MNGITQFKSRGEDGKDILFLTVPEACTRLRIGKWKLYDLIRSKQIPSAKIGSHRLIPTEALEAYARSLWTEALS